MIATKVIGILRKQILIAKHCFVLFCNRVGTTAFRSRDDKNAWEKRDALPHVRSPTSGC